MVACKIVFPIQMWHQKVTDEISNNFGPVAILATWPLLDMCVY